MDLTVDDEREKSAMESFVFECDVPPQLWFDAAQRNGLEDQTAAGRWAQQTFEVDMLMGIEPDDLPPPHNPSSGINRREPLSAPTRTTRRPISRAIFRYGFAYFIRHKYKVFLAIPE